MICIQVKLVKIIKLTQLFKVSGNGLVDTKQMEKACIQSSFIKLCMNCRSVWYLNQDLCHPSHFPTLASWKLHSRLVSQEHKAPSTLSSQLQYYLPRRGQDISISLSAPRYLLLRLSSSWMELRGGATIFCLTPLVRWRLYLGHGTAYNTGAQISLLWLVGQGFHAERCRLMLPSPIH